MELNAFELLRIVHLSRTWQHFPAIVYSFRVTKAKSQNFETITGTKFAVRKKCRLIDVQKLKPYII